MHKKDYELVARVISQTIPEKLMIDSFYAKNMLINNFVTEMTKENWLFNEKVFRDACNLAPVKDE